MQTCKYDESASAKQRHIGISELLQVTYSWPHSERTEPHMERNIMLWTLFCSIYLITCPAGVTAIIRRQFFPENALLTIMGTKKLENHASETYCTEPCTTIVLQASELCESCLLAHPDIPHYMEMIRWQLASDVLISLAYFSIPVELLFFIYKAQVRII